jgi:SAM-dependent methyltransferase
MKHCLICKAEYGISHNSCPACGTAPVVIDGFDAYAPALAHGGGGFKASYFSELARLEGNNFWFRARNQIINWALKQYTPDFESLLEIGCGTGFVSTSIASDFPNAKLSGSEIFTEGLRFAKKRLPSVDLFQMDARQIPFIKEFDVIGAFDVLEHIKEDGVVLSQIYKSLKPNGMILITVPQHKWLWSATDEHAFHERRYSAVEIHKKVEAAGFIVVRSTSFVSILLPAMIISRFFRQRKREKEFDATAELEISPLLNAFFLKLLSVEFFFIKMGLSLPVGGSRLLVAKKA